MGERVDRTSQGPTAERAVGRPRTNLPLQPTTFVGRQQEIDQLLRLLADVRLLTLTGAGGCGKTRLALEVAARALPRHPGGVWLVELAALNDSALVARAVALVLGVAEQPGRQLVDVLADALVFRDLLLILDNCEHLTAASAALVEHLLGTCPGVRILATSRERLNVAGETVWRVASLSFPTPLETSDAGIPAAGLSDRLMKSEAIDLYVQRAVSVQSEFRLTDENAPAVARICQRLDGMPLAIELAAARAAVLSPQQIASRLDDCFRLLSGGTRGAPERQQTLRATLDWSYGLLSPREQQVLAGLSVFSGGWTLEAVEAVCAHGDIEPHDVLDLLAQLVDKSLVQVERRGGETRYRLLETIRQYGRERLEEASQAQGVRSRHRDWYLALAERAEPELWGAEVRLWLDRLDLEHDNLRAALDWSMATDAESGQRLAGSLFLFWERRGYLTEGRSWLRGMLARSAVPAGARPAARAKALLGAGYLARDQGDIAAARSWFDESLAIFQEVGDKWGIGSALRGLGLLAQSEGNCSEARALFEETVSLFRETGHTMDIGWTLRNLGILAQIEGDYARANAFFEESLPILRQLGDKTGTGRVLGSLGILARIRGDYGRASALLDESRSLLLAAGDQRGVSMALGALGSLTRIEGNWAGARGLFEQSLVLGREMGDRSCIAHGLAMSGVVEVQQGAHARGVQLIGAATAIHKLLRSSLETDERTDLDATLAGAEAALGAETFAAAWAHGQAMTADEAIAQAQAPEDAAGGAPPPGASAGGRWPTTSRSDTETSPSLTGAHPAVPGAATSAAQPAGGPAAPISEPRRKRLPGGLTEREAEVLRLVARGKTNREIAADLVISEYTVMRHLSNIFHKIGASSRAAAASFAVREDIS